MRVPLSWLAEYVSLPQGATAETVMAELVKVGLEEESAHGYGLTGPIVVGEVLDFVEEPQTNGKTIRWCQVRVGADDVRGIVCGARNFEIGDKVVVTLPGAVLPGDFRIAARSTYGHTSDGMIASARELGISDDHEGILRLKTIGLDPQVGADALDLLSLNDSAAEVNVTPDRGYCFSIRGIAREYSHATGVSFTDPVSRVVPLVGQGFEVAISDTEPIRGKLGVTKFVTRVVSDIDAASNTPAWMVSRLKLAGMRSISIVVDITNYVMLELGQPIHAYDFDKLQEGFGVRRASAGEVLVTLDGQARSLDAEDLVIADRSGAIGLAGVMGGASTEVTSNTKRVLIEAANFDGVSIARSARRHKLPSEASKRFERGVDPAVAEFAAARVVQLLEELTGGKAEELGSIYSAPITVETIFLPQHFAESITGVQYSGEEILETLSEIGCSVSEVSNGYEVVAPTWRPDLKDKTDLVEEVARIRGYEQIPSRLPVAPPGRGFTKKQKLRRLVANALAANGHIEVLNYPFVSESENNFFTQESLSRVTLANAMQEDSNQMRTSLLPGLLRAAKTNNSRTLVSLSLYEIGSVFLPAKSDSSVVLPSANGRPSEAELGKLLDSIPNQPMMLGVLYTGDRIGQQVGRKSVKASYADAISLVRSLSELLAVEIKIEQSQTLGYHPGRTAVLKIEDKVIGFAGEIHPEISIALDLPRQVAALELNLDLLFAATPDIVGAKPIYTFPAATQDLSLVLNQEIPAALVLETIRKAAGELLEEVVLVDDFRGGNLAADEKSLTFALRFRASDRTLTQAEASAAKEQAVAEANKLFGATLRA